MTRECEVCGRPFAQLAPTARNCQAPACLRVVATKNKAAERQRKKLAAFRAIASARLEDRA